MKNQFTKLSIVTSAFLALTSTSVVADNLIQNGSFEDFTVNRDHGRWKEVTFDNWVGEGEVWNSKIGKPATDSIYKIELDVGKELNELSQVVSTIEGQKYKLSIDTYARRKGTSDFEVLVDGVVIDMIRPNSQWSEYNIYFEGVGAEQVISLRELESQNNGLGAIIDNIRLEESLELIKNGSFEDFTVNKNHGRWKEVTFDDWSGLGEVWNERIGKSSTNGAYKIELDAGRELNVLAQTVTTKEHLEYELSLDAYARTADSSDFEIWVDDKKIQTVTPIDAWQRYSFKFFGTGEVQKIEIREIENQNDSLGTVIDNVSLVPTGEIKEIEPVVDMTKNIAKLYGVATQPDKNGYYYYEAPSNAIDGDLETYNHTQCSTPNNWLQIELPHETEVKKVVIHNRRGQEARLNGSKVYLSNTDFHGTEEIKSNDMIAILNSDMTQTVEFNSTKAGDYLLIKEDNSCLHLTEVEVYGATPPAPKFSPTKMDYLISGTTQQGEIITELQAIDYQGDTLHYSIVDSVPFSINDQGAIEVNGILDSQSYTFDVRVSDGLYSDTISLTINVTSDSAVEDALSSGDVTHITVRELLDEARAEIESLKDGDEALKEIYGDSSIEYLPSYNSQIINIYGDSHKIFPILEGNKENTLAVAGRKDSTNFALFGSHPIYYFQRDENLAYQDSFKNILAWLMKIEPSNLDTKKSIAISFAPYDSDIKSWLSSNFSNWSIKECNDMASISSCQSGADLLIVGHNAGDSNANGFKEELDSRLQEGTPILYLHPNWGQNKTTQAIAELFNVSFPYGGNWWADDKAKWDNSVEMQTSIFSKLHYNDIDTMLSHFQAEDYNFDWSQCKDSSGNSGENYDNCSDVEGLNSEFQKGADRVKSMIDTLDKSEKNIFIASEHRLEKLLVLIGDKFRESVTYPMDKVETDDNLFMQSYYADHAIYNYRTLNPAQLDMGNFSRSDFSHITPTTRRVNLLSKKSFRSTGAYALPGKTVRITRNDNSDLTVKVFINTLRSGATHQFQKNGYNRPKYLQTPHFEIKSGESIELTSPYGGTLQLEFSKNDLPVDVTFENVGEHAYWASEADNASFAQKLSANEFDWAEIATGGFEVHSKLDKMIKSVEDDRWGGTAEGLANAVVKYTSNYPHVLAGFKGEGVDVVPEIHNWADERGITIETIDIMKHMNADQATCGYGCSGNPYDAYWAFDPIGHGDIHEMGHSLQMKRFEGFPNHAATNTFSYYTKSRYFENTGKENDCGGLPFKSVFETIQSAVGQDDVKAYLKTNLWDNAGLGEQYLLKIQAMMHAQKMGKVENGWHVLARVHILEREMKRAKQNWEERKASVGFSTYSLDEINSIGDNDWLVIAYSYAAGLDYKNYFDMMGIPYSQKAKEQIESFGFDVVPNALFVSTDKGYCKEDKYGTLFDRPTLSIDGESEYLY